MPFFERGNNCHDAYYEISEFERATRHGINMASSVKYCMALKIGEYDFALEHLKAMETQSQQAYERNIAMAGKEKLDPEYITRMEVRFLDLKEKIDKVSKRDICYINEYLQNNEQRNLKKLGLPCIDICSEGINTIYKEEG